MQIQHRVGLYSKPDSYYSRHAPHALEFSLGTLSQGLSVLCVGGIQKRERHSHHKNKTQCRKLWSEDIFPYSTKQKEIIKCSLVISICEIFWANRKTCEFAFQCVLYRKKQGVPESMTALLSNLFEAVHWYGSNCLNCFLRY